MNDANRPPRRDTRDLGGTLSEGNRRGDSPDARRAARPNRDPRMKGGGGGVEKPPRRG